MLGHIEIIKGIYDTFHIYKTTFPAEERQILDPLTTMVKLSILAYKPIGTKLAIDNNRIHFQEPSILQGFWRWAYGNKRYELHHLLNPIVKAVGRYHVTNPDIKSIFENAMNGLERLKHNYQSVSGSASSVVIHSLDLYIAIINNALITLTPQSASHTTKMTDVHMNAVKNGGVIFNNLQLEDEQGVNNHNLFKDLWTEDEISLIAKMLDQVTTAKRDYRTYIEAISKILEMKEERANGMLNELTRRL